MVQEKNEDVRKEKKEERSIAGVTHKYETQEYLEKFDIIGLTEIWMDENIWGKIRNKLSNK